MTECKYPSCHRERGEQDDRNYHENKFCSIQCQTKYEHVKADARDARRAEEQRFEEEEEAER